MSKCVRFVEDGISTAHVTVPAVRLEKRHESARFELLAGRQDAPPLGHDRFEAGQT